MLKSFSACMCALVECRSLDASAIVNIVKIDPIYLIEVNENVYGILTTHVFFIFCN